MGVVRLLGGATAMVATLAVTAAGCGLYAGGVSFRKDCVTDHQTVRHEWSFPIWSVLPYVFRPSESGCVTHTGTRVALSAIGVARIDDSYTGIVAELASGEPNRDRAYWARFRAATEQYFKRNDEIASLDDAVASVDGYVADLRELAPPPRFRGAHDDLLRVLARVQEFAAELRSSSAAERPKLEERLKGLDSELRRAVEAVDRARTA